MGRHFLEFMKPGELVCEKNLIGYGMCRKPAKDYKRTPCEAKGWPDPDMPIALCDECAGKRTPIEKPYIFKFALL